MALVHIYCGDGKGKTSAAVGMAVRAAGRGLKVVMVRFLKSDDSGEVAVLGHIPGITVIPCERTFGFVSSMDRETREQAARWNLEQFFRAVELAERADLLILDEIGRGTSTFDGLAIAWAVIEHISNTKLCGAKTLFATHYHELTELEGKIPGVNNYCIAVKEKGDDIVFLRKIVQGGADKSYGIQVAKLAGVPDSVIQRAKELVEELSDADITAAVKDLTTTKKKKPVYDQMDMAQMSLFDTVKDDDIIEEIKGLDMGNMTPIEAMNTLYNLQNKIKNRW